MRWVRLMLMTLSAAFTSQAAYSTCPWEFAHSYPTRTISTVPVRSSVMTVLTCSWMQPPTQRHLSVVLYCAYDMLLLASKHQAVLASLPIFRPLQNRDQMVPGPSA